MNIDKTKTLLISTYSACVLGGVIVGGAAGYFIAKKKLDSHYTKAANEEIASVKAYYSKLLKTGVYSSPVTLFVEKYGDKVEELGYSTEQETPEESAPSITQDTESEDDKDTELADFAYVKNDKDLDIPRDYNRPYVISTAEFMDEEEYFDKLTVTYFEGDDTLTDERDEILSDIEGTIGSASLTMFGTKADDMSTVYIRNENLKADFEVIKDEGSYSEIVGGFRDKSTNQGLRKFRQEE